MTRCAALITQPGDCSYTTRIATTKNSGGNTKPLCNQSALRMRSGQMNKSLRKQPANGPIRTLPVTQQAARLTSQSGTTSMRQKSQCQPNTTTPPPRPLRIEDPLTPLQNNEPMLGIWKGA